MKRKTPRSPWALREPLVCNYLEPKMQTLTRMDRVVIEDYYYTTIADENMNWMKLTHPLSSFPLNLRAPFCISTFTLYFLIAFLDIQTRENNASPFKFTMYTNASNNAPSYTHVSLYMVWRVHPWAKSQVPRMLARLDMDAKSQCLSLKEPFKYG